MLEVIVAGVLVFVSASDGDTLTLRESTTGQKVIIRLAEIDAPERTQPYSQISRRNLLALCANAQQIEMRFVEFDRYGRSVSHVHCNGVHVNWRQVEDGLAWCFTKYLRQPEACVPLERQARHERRGLWRDAVPLEPWIFRSQNRSPVPVEQVRPGP